MTRKEGFSTLFSGIQPTGMLHIGNYLGAILNWVELQNIYNSIFCVVDLHAITVPNIAMQNSISKDTLFSVAAYLACGIDHKKSNIFIQSSNDYHSVLMWILSCYSPMGWLNRMTQFKDKSGNDKSKSKLGLYSYPILMAADILLYDTEYVPVGEDQKQHIEFAIDIADSFNHFYSDDIFVIPKYIESKYYTRVMSLRDGRKKMSKSDISDFSRINIIDDNDLICEKIKSARTDSILGFELSSLKDRPEANNLMHLLAVTSKKSIDDLCTQIDTFSDLKAMLKDSLINIIEPIRSSIFDYVGKNSDFLISVIKDGNEYANNIACRKIKKIKESIGFLQI